MKILVTGAGGFIGSHLLDELAANGHQVTGLDNYSNGLKSNNSMGHKILDADITSSNELETLDDDFDIIYHLAALGSVPRSIRDPDSTFDANITGVKNILGIARKHGSRVIFSSSSSVYGANQTVPMSSKSWLAPISPYAASKASGEALVSGYANAFNFDSLIFRFFNVYGPRQRHDSAYAAVLPKFLKAIKTGEELEIHGDGNQIRDFTFVFDVVAALAICADKQIDSASPINLAFGNPISINALVDTIEIVSGIKANRKSLPERTGDLRNSSADPSLLLEKFPEVKCTPLIDGVRVTWESSLE